MNRSIAEEGTDLFTIMRLEDRGCDFICCIPLDPDHAPEEAVVIPGGRVAPYTGKA